MIRTTIGALTIAVLMATPAMAETPVEKPVQVAQQASTPARAAAQIVAPTDAAEQQRRSRIQALDEFIVTARDKSSEAEPEKLSPRVAELLKD